MGRSPSKLTSLARAYKNHWPVIALLLRIGDPEIAQNVLEDHPEFVQSADALGLLSYMTRFSLERISKFT